MTDDEISKDFQEAIINILYALENLKEKTTWWEEIWNIYRRFNYNSYDKKCSI